MFYQKFFVDLVKVLGAIVAFIILALAIIGLPKSGPKHQEKDSVKVAEKQLDEYIARKNQQ